MIADRSLQISLFVEGFHDKLFVKRILEPRLLWKYEAVQIHQYASIPDQTLLSHFRSLKRMPSTHFFILADYDEGPCISARRQDILQRFLSLLQSSQILIVRCEIESWYLAGVPEENPFGVSMPSMVETINKQGFSEPVRNLVSTPPYRLCQLNERDFNDLRLELSSTAQPLVRILRKEVGNCVNIHEAYRQLLAMLLPLLQSGLHHRLGAF
jgi:hypothetical protein